MKGIGIIALVIALLLLGGYFLFMQSDTPSEDMQNTEEVNGGVSVDATGDVTIETEPIGDPVFHALVSYTDAGFEPAETTIRKGQTVRFVNNHSSRDSWIASAIHPTHSVYPTKSTDDCLGSSFDTCRGLKAGEFWEFTFNEVGTWGYHDHLRASQTGKIIVTE